MKDKKLLIAITLLLIFIPTVVGLVFWEQLPAQIPTHWDSMGEIDRVSNKAFVVFGLPAIIAGMHLITVIGTAIDPREKEIPKKALDVLLWIFPTISTVLCLVSYGVSMGMEIDIIIIVSIILGFVLMALGNYMPKTHRNFTFGIKTPWAILDEDNWNKSSRFAGWCAVVAGIICFINVFIRSPWVLIIPIPLLGIVPVCYSYILYRKKKNSSES